jgi:hypothetical protein
MILDPHDSEPRRREALRRLRAPRPPKDERPDLEPSYILGEEIYIPASWRCDHCDTRRPVPEQLAVRGSSVATARRIVGMYRAWEDLRELFYRDQLPELRRPLFLSWPTVCVWCRIGRPGRPSGRALQRVATSFVCLAR